MCVYGVCVCIGVRVWLVFVCRCAWVCMGVGWARWVWGGRGGCGVGEVGVDGVHRCVLVCTGVCGCVWVCSVGVGVLVGVWVCMGAHG